MSRVLLSQKRPPIERSTGTLPAGQRTDLTGMAVRNIILLSIPDDEFSFIRPHLDNVDLPYHQILHLPGERIDFGYFVNGGLMSLVIETSDGRSVEVGIVGKEGFLGAALAVNVNRSPYRAVVQVPADGLRIRTKVLEESKSSLPHLYLLLNRCAHIQGLQVAQLAACDRLHEIEQRLARWLLMSRDRVDSGSLSMTHDFLAQMLGTGRPSVTLAAGILQKAG
jgi:CRP-like cAMP-binding protein